MHDVGLLHIKKAIVHTIKRALNLHKHRKYS